jgi:hypothetical protein
MTAWAVWTVLMAVTVGPLAYWGLYALLGRWAR